MISKEIERKMLISKEMYEHLLKEYNCVTSNRILQINYYYDTHDREMHRNGNTLRIRQLDNQLTLQLKTKEKDGNDIRISNEHSISIQVLPQIIRINNINTYYLGELITERVEFSLNSYILFLDKNTYLGKVDYELEIEAKNEEDMPTIVFGLMFNKPSFGKYARFLNCLDTKKQNNRCLKLNRTLSAFFQF